MCTFISNSLFMTEIEKETMVELRERFAKAIQSFVSEENLYTRVCEAAQNFDNINVAALPEFIKDDYKALLTMITANDKNSLSIQPFVGTLSQMSEQELKVAANSILSIFLKLSRIERLQPF